MAKLQGKAKQEFINRMNKGRVKAGLKKIGGSVKKKAKKAGSSLTRSKRSKGSTMAKQKSKSKHKSTASKLYDKKNIKTIAIKTAIGTGIGAAI